MDLAQREIDRLKGLVDALERKIQLLERLPSIDNEFQEKMNKVERDIIFWKNHKNF